ncbi:conserved protein [Tepidicaulis marinus]|uniref:Conserved protein n=1 Tax=Tepidicaulis marinus TaxID=1333998 RepID=A0A081BD06_9HYPH|nr:hypothetical protein [Tepidicaulis marinus]GAK45924.1 conserved protein [Tepidicaulis marinus]
MKLARWIYIVAAVYGIAVLVPQLFMEAQIGALNPPAITHPEFFYGFIGTALVWQVLFLLIASDPVRYRALMPITFLEKLAFAVPVAWLYAEGRVGGGVVLGGLIDALLLAAFIIAYRSTPRHG